MKFTLEGVRGLVRRLVFRHFLLRPFHLKSDPARAKYRWEFKEPEMEAAPRGVYPGGAGIWFQDEARARR